MIIFLAFLSMGLVAISLIVIAINLMFINRRFEEVEACLANSHLLKTGLMIARCGGVKGKLVLFTWLVVMFHTKQRSIRKGLIEREVLDNFPKSLEQKLKRDWWLEFILVTGGFGCAGVAKIMKEFGL